MLKNYLIVAIRHILKNKLFTFINISGLAIGMTSFILLMLYVYNELKYDRYNENIENLYRIIEYSKQTGEYGAVEPVILKKYIVDGIPEINKGGIIVPYECNLSTGGVVFHEKNFALCDTSIFDMFSWKIIKGDKKKPFTNANSILLSPEMAEKYFGNDNPIGKTISCDDSINYLVSGIVEIPKETHLKLDFLVSTATLEKLNAGSINNWYNSSCNIYLQVENEANIKNIEQKINNIARKNSKGVVYDTQFKLQAVKKIHLYSNNIQYDNAIKGNIVYIRSFIFIALLILIIASLNYINLSTAKAGSRAKEIGIRKVLGSYKRKLIKQMLGETVIVTSVAGIFSLLLLEISIPFFNELSGMSVSIVNNGKFILLITTILVLTISFISGIYPAFILSTLQPIDAIKGTKQLFGVHNRKGLWDIGFRKILFIVQICITMGLIISSLVIYQQIEFIRQKNIGFNKEQLLVVTNPEVGKFFQRYRNYKNAIRQNTNILAISASHNIPSNEINNYCGIRLAGANKDSDKEVAFVSVDFSFFKTIGAQIVKGRDFSGKFVTDSINACIINEAAAKILNLDKPIGKKLKGFYDSKPREIIGVLKNINFRSFHYKAQPMVFIVSERKYPWYVSNFVLKINTSNTSSTIKYLETEFNKIEPKLAFNYYFIDENFENLYKLEEHAKTVIDIFTSLAVLISVIGLYGLIYFIAESKTREISIRKIFGAKVKRLIYNVLFDFFKLIVVASIIIVPLSYILLNQWLKSYAYRIDIGFGVFIIAFLISAFIVFATIIYKTYRAANINPAKALKYE